MVGRVDAVYLLQLPSVKPIKATIDKAYYSHSRYRLLQLQSVKPITATVGKACYS